jgi:hypothetical protein
MKRRFQYGLRTLAGLIAVVGAMLAVWGLLFTPYDIGFRSGPPAPTRPLAVAAFECDGDALEALLKNPKTKIDEQDEMGRTALHWAALGGCKDAIQRLLDHGANSDLVDVMGNTAGDIAHYRGHDDVAQMIQGAQVQKTAQRIGQP